MGCQRRGLCLRQCCEREEKNYVTKTERKGEPARRRRIDGVG